MTMRITRLADAEPFTPVGHDGVGPVRLQGGDRPPRHRRSPSCCRTTCPRASAELAPQPVETVYVVLAGALVMTSEGEEATLGPHDSVHFTPGTVRSVENRTNLPGQHARHPVPPPEPAERAEPDEHARHRRTYAVTVHRGAEAGSALQHQPAHRSVPGDFNATLATFAAMALYDHLDGEQRARVVVPLDDENRTNWNFLPESGRRGVADPGHVPDPAVSRPSADRRSACRSRATPRSSR